MSNKRGSWTISGWQDLSAILGVIVLLFGILKRKIIVLVVLLIFGLYLLGVFGPKQPPPEPPNRPNSTIPTPLPFNSSQISITFLPSNIENKYSNSNNLVCYVFNNPNNKTNDNFTLLGEWFLDDGKLPSATYYNETLDYNDTFGTPRFNWYPVGNYSKVKFRVVLSRDKEPLVDETINYSLTKNVSFDTYLSNENNITWDNQLIKELIKGAELCGKDEEEQVRAVLSFVRNKMNPPLKTDEIIYYDQNQLSSEKSWNEKRGTSSEYSYVFTSFLRAIGIPAKIETNRFEDYDYYHVKVYVSNKGWLPVDVFNKSKKIGDCFLLEKFSKDREYKDVCVPILSDYVVFDKISTHTPTWATKIDYGIKNVYFKQLQSYCIKVNITFFGKNETAIFYKNTYLLNNDINKASTLPSDFFIENKLDFESIKIELDQFSKSCE